MGLRDKTPCATPITTMPASAGGRPAPAVIPVTETPAPAARRDLAALRAQLAGNGGINPPEAAAAIKDDLLDPVTRETADGGAELIPTESTPPSNASTPAPVEGTKRKRRTKAEMEAARAAESAPTETEAEPLGGLLDASLEELLREVLRRLA